MLHILKEVASTWWLITTGLSVLFTIGFAIVLYILNQQKISKARTRFSPLVSAISNLSDCKLENLKAIDSAFRKHLPELTAEVTALDSDSKSMYRGLWIPAPETRLVYPEIFPKTVQQALRPGMDFPSALIGLVLTAAAFLLAMVDKGSTQLDSLVQMLCLIPVLLGLFTFLWIRDQHSQNERSLLRLHRSLMQAIERKVPVYSQASETAIVLSRFQDHDQLMTQSVTQLASRVDKMASGEITDAVSNALKFVLSATIGPALQKSTDSLSMLSVALEKQMRNSMNTLGDRFAALEFEQKESSKFLKNQYETVTSTLLKQQEMSFTQLRKVQELLLEQISDQQKQTLMMLTENQQRTLSALTDGQHTTYKTLSEEQQNSLQQMMTGYQSAVTSMLTLSETSQKQLTEQYGNAWTTVQSGLDQALNSLKESQQVLFTSVQTKQEELTGSLQARHESLTTSLQTHQDSLAISLSNRQDEMTKSLKTQQEILASSLQTRHEELTKTLQTQVEQVTGALASKLSELSSSLLSQQEKMTLTLTGSQTELTTATKSLTQEVTTALLTQQEQLGKTLTDSQVDLAESTKNLTQEVSNSLLSQQEQLSTSLQTRQDELTASLQSRYDELTKAIQTQQVDLAAAMQNRQDEVMNAFQTKQMDLVLSLKNSQEALYAATNALQEKLSTTFHSQQLAAIEQMQNAQDATLQKVADYQQVSLSTLTDDVAKNFGTYLDKYLDPVSARLIASADVLVAAQAYADKVQDAFELQREQVAIVEAGMKDAIQSFVETRTTMMNDLSDLRKSTSVISTSADKMSAIFAGSEAGLSDSIKLLSGNMEALGQDLASNIGTYLDKHLDPVSTRLVASADVLVAAQSYADKVQDAFEMQREQVAIVEAGMKEAIQSFVDTRTTMMNDLTDLRKSTTIMSNSADKMSAIFAGSESGLSDSIALLSGNMSTLGQDLERITSGTAKTTKDLQEQIEQSHNLNQRQIGELTTQIITFSDELSTRIEQLTLGFTQVTEDLVKSVRSAINDQNDTLTGNVRHLVEVMSEESRSMSLFAQQINMDIDSLSTTLSSSVAGFNADIRSELSGVLSAFDQDIANVLKRLSQATNELGDAVESLPAALAPLKKN